MERFLKGVAVSNMGSCEAALSFTIRVTLTGAMLLGF